MNPHLPQLIDPFAGLNVLVVGEAMLDRYLEGTTSRFCPEAPVPIVALAARRDLPGGAANAAVNARALGGTVRLLSVVGADPEGDLLRQALAERGVDTEHVLTHLVRTTLAKQRVTAAGQLLLRLDHGSTGPLDEGTEQELIDRLAALYPRADAVLVSDYGYGILTPRVVDALAHLQARWSKVLVADSRRVLVFGDAGVTAV
jgi:D-beta-D-heptose 7-phosphate kinase/D-beta-D-heptose 1-phosphate adenosyltransferase